MSRIQQPLLYDELKKQNSQLKKQIIDLQKQLDFPPQCFKHFCFGVLISHLGFIFYYYLF